MKTNKTNHDAIQQLARIDPVSVSVGEGAEVLSLS